MSIMTASSTDTLTLEQQLQNNIAIFPRDPHGFVKYAYPWGNEGTPLEDEEIEAWQSKLLSDLTHALKYGWVMNEGVKVDCTAGIRIAVASGHGIGKSALMAWLNHWFTSTHPNPQIITTANTDGQLKTKTWREVGKWHKLLINAHWFLWTATRFICRAEPNTWFSVALPWSDTKPESFAGTHEKYVMFQYDEASSIPDIIWETTEGAMTDVGGIKIWIVFGNPTRNTGRFAECFGRFRHRWIKYRIDSRTCKRTDKARIAEWIADYGDDSDFVRVRVKGQFPRAGSLQFIGNDLVDAAAVKEISPHYFAANKKILGVDIARFGDDKTVFIRRQGLAAYSMKKMMKVDSITVAGLIAQEIKEYQPDHVFLDMGNTGAAIYDILLSWGYTNITGVWFGSQADEEDKYFNKRAEMWGRMKDWLKNGASIPDDNELKADLIGPEYGFTAKEQIQLESKKDMKKRDLPSPDCADALAVTFAYPVPETPANQAVRGQQVAKAVTEYDPLNYDTPQASQVQVRTEYDPLRQ